MPCAHIPDLDCLVVAAGSKISTVGRPGHAIYGSSGVAMDEEFSAREGVPDLHAPVGTDRGNAPTIGRPHDGIHALRMTFITELAAGGEKKVGKEGVLVFNRTPDLDGFILAARGDAFAIR